MATDWTQLKTQVKQAQKRLRTLGFDKPERQQAVLLSRAEHDELLKAKQERDSAVFLLAEWCVSVELNGTGWDDWDEHYKDAAYRPGPLREALDAGIAEEKTRRR